MDISELEPVKKQPEKKNLDEMSIEALGEYIEELKSEISRVEEMIKLKKTARDGAESFFKS
jgi:uncharacterized small protein (DUF1192 family)